MNSKYACRRGRALRIAIGIMMLMLVMAGGAEATKFIRDDATGGDCDSFGTWNSGTKTCTMTADLIETIQIDSNDTTLDGNGYSISGSKTGNGINLTGRSGVTIKDLNVGQFGNGFYLLNSNNNYLIGNKASGNTNGIYLSGSSSNTLSSNNANTNYNNGIYLSSSSNNALSGNNANSNYYGIFLSYSDNNTLNGNNANSNTYRGIVLDNSKINNLIGNNANLNKNFDGIFLSSSSSNRLSGNIANSNNDNGIFLSYSNSNRLNSNIVSSNNGNGIYLYPQSSSNTLNGNIASSNNAGIRVYFYSNSNTVNGNNASNNKYGIYLETDSNKLSGNIASSNSVNGIYLSGSNNNIYNNSFNNTINFVIKDGSNTWNTDKISGTNVLGDLYLGGNFWAYPNGTGFSQTCTDSNKDGICDTQYTLDSNNIDYLPLAKSRGTTLTKTSTPFPTPISTSIQSINYTILDINKTSATAPEINEIIIKKLSDDILVLNVTALSISGHGIKMITVNGNYVDTRNFYFNVTNEKIISIVATDNDGNITTENISLTNNINSNTIPWTSYVSILVAVLAILAGLFKEKILEIIDKKNK